MNNEELVAARNLVAAICRDGGHHAEAAGFAKACVDAQNHVVRLRHLVENVLELGDVVCDQLGAAKSERAGNHHLAEVMLMRKLDALRLELAVVEGWERSQEPER
jgi:hypothetical protein